MIDLFPIAFVLVAGLGWDAFRRFLAAKDSSERLQSEEFRRALARLEATSDELESKAQDVQNAAALIRRR